MYGKNNLLTASFVQLVHCSCHLVFLFSISSVITVFLHILSYAVYPFSCIAAFLARWPAVFISLYADMCLHPVEKHCPS
jgi:hypothetical protein